MQFTKIHLWSSGHAKVSSLQGKLWIISLNIFKLKKKDFTSQSWLYKSILQQKNCHCSSKICTHRLGSNTPEDDCEMLNGN